MVVVHRLAPSFRMSASPDHIVPNLYCTESDSEVVSSDTEIDCHCCILWPGFDHPIDEESSILRIFDSENDQTPRHTFLRALLNSDEFVTSRCNAINWMLKVHVYHNFRHETAYLSVSYLDRFLCSRTLPEGKRWSWQLLSVACLSLAAKMEETRVPLLLDLQVLKPEFMFKPKTVQRMELLVMTSLGWQLRIVTPFDFVDYFIRKLSCTRAQVNHLCCISSGVSDLILRTCRAIDFLDYRPSTIAAAAVLCAIGHNFSDQNIVIFHERVSKDMVKRCHLLFEEHLIPPSFRRGFDDQMQPDL